MSRHIICPYIPACHCPLLWENSPPSVRPLAALLHATTAPGPFHPCTLQAQPLSARRQALTSTTPAIEALPPAHLPCALGKTVLHSSGQPKSSGLNESAIANPAMERSAGGGGNSLSTTSADGKKQCSASADPKAGAQPSPRSRPQPLPFSRRQLCCLPLLHHTRDAAGPDPGAQALQRRRGLPRLRRVVQLLSEIHGHTGDPLAAASSSTTVKQEFVHCKRGNKNKDRQLALLHICNLLDGRR